MTIDELRARKQELLARKRYELELQAKGEGDNLALFMVEEELLDVNAQIRAFGPSRRVGNNRVMADHVAGRLNRSDKQQFIDWTRQNEDDDADEEREQMRRMLHDGIASISGRQREVLLMWSNGFRVKDIARRLGVDESVASRTLKRAQKNVRRIAGTRLAVEQLRDENRLDMSKPEVARLLMSTLTAHQAVCFYLYYAEWLTVRQIGQLINVDHSTICRTIQRALLRINEVLGADVDVLENVEELDALAFSIYCGLCERSEELPPAVRARIKTQPSKGYQQAKSTWKTPRGVSLLKPTFRIKTKIKAKRGVLRPQQHGRLLRTLQERYQGARPEDIYYGTRWEHPVVRWLVKVFQIISKYKPRGVRCGAK